VNFKAWIIVGVFGGFCTSSFASSFIEMRLAYFDHKSDGVQVVFPNDSFPRFVSQSPLLTERDFVSVKIVEASISKTALIKFNAAANQTDMPGLGVFIKGKPVNLFQTLHPLQDPVLWLTGLSETEMNSLVQLLSN
jgi:hypothetical protein